MIRLTGRDAIEYAEKHCGETLSKHSDPTEDGRDGLTVEEAEDVARDDAGLIYLDVDGNECESCLESGETTLATTRSRNPEFSGYALCEECAAEYDSRMDPEPKPIIHEKTATLAAVRQGE